MAGGSDEPQPGPTWEPTPRGEVRDPEAMEDEQPFVWGPDE